MNRKIEFWNDLRGTAARVLAVGVTICSCLLAAFPPAFADPPASVLGISKQKPADGPSVKVEGGYMVPYKSRIPGTEVEFEMIPVPGGKFLFGSKESEEDRKDDEGPQVEIEVQPMWVAKTEVRWEEYHEYMSLYLIFKEFEAKGQRKVTEQNRVDAITAPTELYDSSFTYEYGDDPMQPAVTMTQYAAQQYTKWLSLVTGQQYRLPTESEWEYAARGGTTTAFSWGDDPEAIDDYAWYYDNSDEGPGHVGTKKPNPFGLHDMHGNVAEWTVGQYSEQGYDWLANKPANAIDAVQWPTTADPCAVRGGSWEMDPPDLRSASRLASVDEMWKEEDPNFPKSPWWFTSDPARGVGFRLFRSYQPLSREKISKFWEASAEDVLDDVESRLVGGRGGLGLVDKDLPAAIQAVQK